MSIQEQTFIRWFGGIAAALVISFTIGGVAMYRSVGTLQNITKYNEREINELREFHKEDVKLIRDDILEIKEDSKEIKSDIKKLLAR